MRLSLAVVPFLLEVALAHSAYGASNRSASLSWDRGTEADECPGPTALANAVEFRLGQQIFALGGAADLVVRASIARSTERWHVSISLSDRQGGVLGQREIDDTGSPCDGAFAAGADAIVSLIQPYVMQPAPAQAVASASLGSVVSADTGETKATRSGWRADVEAIAAMAWGVLPDQAPGVGARLRITPSSLPVGLELFAMRFGEQTSLMGALGGAQISLTLAGIGACVKTFGAGPAEGLTCAGAELGTMPARGRGYDPEREGTGSMFDLDLRQQISIHLLEPVAFLAEGALAGVIYRDSFEAQGGTIPIFQTSPVVGRFGIGIGLSF
jgi:hypothetical protein